MHLFSHLIPPLEILLLNIYQHITGFREERHQEKTGIVREGGKVERSNIIFPSGGAAGANTQRWENPDLCRTQ